MAKGSLKVRANGVQVKPYTSHAKDEVADALAEMEADRKETEKEWKDELEALGFYEGEDFCEEWPNEELMA